MPSIHLQIREGGPNTFSSSVQKDNKGLTWLFVYCHAIFDSSSVPGVFVPA